MVRLDGYVYFVTIGNLIKIGMTQNFHQRFKALRSQYGKDIAIVGIIYVDNRGNMENFLHNRFADYHVKDELFEDSPDLRNYVKYLEVTYPAFEPHGYRYLEI